MNDELPDPEQYKHIRMAARQYLREARETTDEPLGMSIDISLEDEIWAFRIHIFEKNADPENRLHVKYEGTAAELEPEWPAR